MAFEKLVDLSTDDAVSLGGVNKKTGKVNPTTITGYFIGSRQVDSPKSKTGKAALHVFQTEKGNIGVWGKTDLDNKLERAVIGALTRVTFIGMKETKNNPMYTFSIEIDRDNVIDVGSVGTATSDASSEGGYSDDEPSYGDEEEELDVPLTTQSRAPSNPVRQPSAEQQKRVQDLLNQKRK